VPGHASGIYLIDANQIPYANTHMTTSHRISTMISQVCAKAIVIGGRNVCLLCFGSCRSTTYIIEQRE
jgi:hypothetical protein